MQEEEVRARMEHDKVGYIKHALDMMERQNEEFPELTQALTDCVLNTMGELARFYMHVAHQVAYIKTMESSYREWEAMRSVNLSSV